MIPCFCKQGIKQGDHNSWSFVVIPWPWREDGPRGQGPRKSRGGQRTRRQGKEHGEDREGQATARDREAEGETKDPRRRGGGIKTGDRNSWSFVVIPLFDPLLLQAGDQTEGSHQLIKHALGLGFVRVPPCCLGVSQSGALFPYSNGPPAEAIPAGTDSSGALQSAHQN